ncbi:MAG TPA: GNAT family N-acetyltransferase [Ktedonobacterales bacterium]
MRRGESVGRAIARGVVNRRISPVYDDLYALCALLAHTPEIVRSGDDIRLSALREQLTWPGHAPERDRWVVTPAKEPDRLIGYGAVFKATETPRADFVIAVHPAARRRGLGAELLKRAGVDALAPDVSQP